MKKVLIVYGVLVIIVLILAFAKFSGNFFSSPNSPKATINNKTFKVKIAKTDAEKMKGLSNVKTLKKDEGMLFIFEEKGKYSFWMKDTFIPLDIIHINDGKIVQIFKNAPPQAGKKENLPIYRPEQDANYVLEINGGLSDDYKFKNGDTVKLEGI